MSTPPLTEPSLAAAGERGALDVQLLTQMIEGDRNAFVALYDRYVRPVHAYSLTHLEHSEDAEEVTQDVFVTLWEKRDSIRIHGTSALPWLLVTCKNMIANRRRSLERRRRRTVTTSIVDERAPGDMASPERMLHNKQLAQILTATIESLPDDDRIVFEACVVDGLSYAAAAERIGVSSGAVRNRLSRIRIRLRSELHTLKGTS